MDVTAAVIGISCDTCPPHEVHFGGNGLRENARPVTVDSYR